MTRRAGGADSSQQTGQHHRYTTPPHSTTLDGSTPPHHEKRQIPARPSAAHSTAQPAQSVPIPQHSQQDSAQHATRQTMKRDTHELYRTQAILLTRRAAHASKYRARREANPRTRYGGTRGHLGRGRGKHKRAIFKPGYCTHGLFIASAFGYPYSVAQ